jgi:hypothetical protein
MRRIAVLILAAAALAAQTKTSAKATPRMPDGKPDLSGFWQGPLLRNMFESVGGPLFTPAGEAAYRYNMTQSRRTLPVRGRAAGQHQRRAV